MRYAPAAVFLLFATPAAAGDLCFTTGATTYRLAKSGPADVRIRVDAVNPAADLRMQIVEQAEIADFIIADDIDEPGNPCESGRHLTTIRADDSEPRPDVVVVLSPKPDTADFRIYVHSARYAPKDAAAFLAAMWKSSQRRDVAERR